ncbi:DsbA family protein [Ferrovibrio sp.]|uniref:DsbA family protein n=1 Tax=Ferrovibrio sp. TaxID=1917215 RepID=UPI00311F1444
MRFRTRFSILAPAMLLAGLLAAAPVRAQQPAAFSAEQKKAIESVIRDYLLQNPEVLVEAMHALEARQQEKAAAQGRAAIAAHAKEIYDDGVSYVAGNPKGDVTIVEFFDYRCGYCKQVQPHIEALLKEDRNLRVVLKELPVLGPESVTAARAAVAALEQEKGAKYFAFHNAMMAFRGQLGEEAVLRMAKEAGLDVAKLKVAMQSPKTEAVLRANLSLADRLGIQGTPGFVIGDQLIPGAISLDSMRELVKAQRG